MQRIIEYTVFFIVLILLQVLLFNNINLGVYVLPLVYIAFIIMLPMETPPVVILLCGLLCGVIMDVTTGAGGINTIATLLTSFCRPYIVQFLIGRDEAKEGGTPSPWRIGMGKFFRYCSVMVVLQCLVYFSFETLSFSYYHLILLRVFLSSAMTVMLVYFAQMLLPGSTIKSRI